MRPIILFGGFIVCLVLLFPARMAPAQSSELEQVEAPVAVDSGWVRTRGAKGRVAFSTLIHVHDAPWLRMQFQSVDLGAAPRGGEPTVLQIVSLADGAAQTLDAHQLEQWNHTSAYFNGDLTLVQILADPGAQPSRVVMTSVLAGVTPEGGVASICGPLDDRILSDDPRVARALPSGCTAWLIDDPNHTFLSAGHCAGGLELMEFNVPLSLPNGAMQHPPPQDQYVVDPTSLQSINGGNGNDWSYFGCFPNSQTDQTPFEAQGEFFVLTNPPPVSGQTLRVTGYGTDSSPNTSNNVQQTHTGPYVALNGNVVNYAVDTTGGSSGSPVIHEADGVAIAIHTNGGCNTAGSNFGTSLANANLQNALANPLGVCVPVIPLQFIYPAPRPQLIDPAGGSGFTVELEGQGDNLPEGGSAEIHLDTGAGFVATSLPETALNLYQVAFPPIECGSVVSYFLLAATTKGEIITDPPGAPAVVYTAFAGDDFDSVFVDNFQFNLGWTVTNGPGLVTGAWQRGLPDTGGDSGEPPTDADGSGRCFVTGLFDLDNNNDVDGGSTTLTSPTLDATQGDAHITYHRWYSNSHGAAPASDVFTIEVSADNGARWVILETVGPAGPEVDGGWFYRSFRIADFVEQTNQFHIRFIASDTGADSVVEAGVDGVRLNQSASGLVCNPAIPGDLDENGVVDGADLGILLLAWGDCPAKGECEPDFNDDNEIDGADLGTLLLNWTP